jgi:hypothetical protein
MAPMQKENEQLHATVVDLQMRLLQERHRREDLEVRAEALRIEHQQMEAEGQAMAEQLTRDASHKKCKLRDLICLSLAEYDAWPCFTALEVELCLAWEAVTQLTEAGDRVKERAKKAIEEL